MSLLPSFTTSTFADRLIHTDENNFLAGPDAVLKSTVTDSGSSPTTSIRKGQCIVKKTSDGLYYLDDGLANASSADRNAAAVVTASETADGDWASKTITVTTLGGKRTVTLGGADDTDAEVVTAWNADADGKSLAVASASGGRVIFTSTAKGAHVHMLVESNLTTAFGTSGTAASGTDADYLITEQDVSMLHPATNAVADRPVRTSRKANYDESELLNLSAEARSVFARRGASFG